MQRLEVSGAVRSIYVSLGVKRLRVLVYYICSLGSVNKNRLVDLFVVGRPARKREQGVFISLTARQMC